MNAKSSISYRNESIANSCLKCWLSWGLLIVRVLFTTAWISEFYILKFSLSHLKFQRSIGFHRAVRELGKS